MLSLKDSVVIVTGASSGIGRATAIAFAQKGAVVVLAARRLDRLQALEQEISRAGGRSLVIQSDVTRETEVERLFAEALQQLGRVDILVNNAGHGLRGNLVDTSYADWQAVLDANLTSVFLCSRAMARSAAPPGRKRHIITVGSIGGLIAAPSASAYGAAKRGVTGFMRAIRWELRPLGIKTTTLYPARVATEFFDIDSYPRKPGRGQMLLPADLARYIVAIATRSVTRRAAIRLWLILKRIYYLARYPLQGS